MKEAFVRNIKRKFNNLSGAQQSAVVGVGVLVVIVIAGAILSAL